MLLIGNCVVRATFKRVVKKKSIENYKGLPYVCTLLSTSLWSFYGLLKPGGLLIVTVNGAGAVLEAIYVTLYIIYAPKDTRVSLSLSFMKFSHTHGRLNYVGTDNMNSLFLHSSLSFVKS